MENSPKTNSAHHAPADKADKVARAAARAAQELADKDAVPAAPVVERKARADPADAAKVAHPAAARVASSVLQADNNRKSHAEPGAASAMALLPRFHALHHSFGFSK